MAHLHGGCGFNGGCNYGGCGLSCGLWWLWLMVAAAHGGANFNWAVADAEWQLRL